MNSEISLGDLDDSSKIVTDGLRQELDLNSPKSGAIIVGTFVTPESLITQVNQEDVERQKEIAKQIVRRLDDSEESEREIVSYEKTPNPRSYTKCISCCLCRGRSRESAQYTKSNEESSDFDYNKRVVCSDSSDGWDAIESKINEQIDLNGEGFVLEFVQPEEDWLLAPVAVSDTGRKCLVLDLDETLVHSKFEPSDCSFNLTIDLDGTEYGVYVRKRPYVDAFIAECAKMYELVVFTASLPAYANPVLDILDKEGLIKHRLFRGSCVFYEERFFVKDLSQLGRNMKDCIIIDNSMLSFLFNPTNAIACTSWYGDQSDTELRDLLPVLSGPLLATNDVRTILDGGNQSCKWLIKQYGDRNSESESTSSY
jgi:RNA polymerase II subunit A small phosphatase-like protein